jgi:hypothetical protein
MRYHADNWYWIVGGDTTQLWSSAKAGYVPAADIDYAAFLAAGGAPASIASLDELTEVFKQQYPGGMLSTYAVDVRWRNETGGIVVGGVPIATDDRSKQMIVGARIAADADPNWSTEWVGADGNVYPVTATAMIAISDAVQAHVNDCFVTYAAVKADIDAGTIITREQIDAAFAA